MAHILSGWFASVVGHEFRRLRLPEVIILARSFGRTSVEFSSQAFNQRQLTEEITRDIGFAGQLLVLSPIAQLLYKMTDFYSNELERTIAWNDPALSIAWPFPPTTVSMKDRMAPLLENAEVFPYVSGREKDHRSCCTGKLQ